MSVSLSKGSARRSPFERARRELKRIPKNLRHFFSRNQKRQNRITRGELRQIDAWSRAICGSGKKLKLLFVTHDLSSGGAPRLLGYLAEWCRQNNYAVGIASPQDGPLRDEFCEIPILVSSHLAETKIVARVFGHFDLVVVNTVRLANVVIAIARQDISVIWWLHETKLGERYLRKDPAVAPALAKAAVILAPSGATLEVYRSRTNRPLRKLISGIPTCTAGTVARKTDCVRFLMVGTIEERKGQDLLLKAIRLLPPTAIERTSFEIVGGGTEQNYIAAIHQAAQEISNLSVTDALTHRDCLEKVASADVLICASRDEAMPLTLLEAMSLGKAIIATNVGGIPEYLRDGETALLIPPENPNALADAIEKIVSSRELETRLGANARATFQARHTLEHFGRAFAEVISQLPDR